jgi:hypothetical protein
MTAVSRLWPIVSGSVRDICPGSSKCTSVQARFRSPRRHACSGRSGFWTRPISRCRRSPCAQASVACGDSIRCSLRFIGDRQLRSGVPANRPPRKRRLPVEAHRSSAERTRPLLAHLRHVTIAGLSLLSGMKRESDFGSANGSFWREAAVGLGIGDRTGSRWLDLVSSFLLMHSTGASIKPPRYGPLFPTSNYGIGR